MNRKYFWFGYLLAVAALLWILWRQRREEVEEILQRVQRATPGDYDWIAEPSAKDATAPSPTEESAPAEPASEIVDDLKQINGIGPAYERRLNEAGIVRYGQLAALSPEEVRERIQLEGWRGDVEGWIAQARALAS